MVPSHWLACGVHQHRFVPSPSVLLPYICYSTVRWTILRTMIEWANDWWWRRMNIVRYYEPSNQPNIHIDKPCIAYKSFTNLQTLSCHHFLLYQAPSISFFFTVCIPFCWYWMFDGHFLGEMSFGWGDFCAQKKTEFRSVVSLLI